MDRLCDSLSSVGAGIDDRIHDGWSHSCPAGRCHRRDADPRYSGTKTDVTTQDLAGQGELFTQRALAAAKSETTSNDQNPNDPNKSKNLFS